ncbi:MAG: nucleotide exchange factor GrpE [Candidatus Helarchaeota archaeon]
MLTSFDFDDFVNMSEAKKREKVIQLNEEEYNRLKEKAKNYDVLLKQYKELKNKLEKTPISEADLNKLKAKAELSKTYLEKLARLQAEFENYRKISERENQKFKKFALKNILVELLRLYDDLERALNSIEKEKNSESVKKGLQMILNNLKKLLENEGVRPIDAKGEIFDPLKHHVCMVENVKNNENIPNDIVLEEIEKGYYYKDEVLRPSMVRIARTCE